MYIVPISASCWSSVILWLWFIPWALLLPRFSNLDWALLLSSVVLPSTDIVSSQHCVCVRVCPCVCVYNHDLSGEGVCSTSPPVGTEFRHLSRWEGRGSPRKMTAVERRDSLLWLPPLSLLSSRLLQANRTQWGLETSWQNHQLATTSHSSHGILP